MPQQGCDERTRGPMQGVLGCGMDEAKGGNKRRGRKGKERKLEVLDG